jgi:hypothetical protein
MKSHMKFYLVFILPVILVLGCRKTSGLELPPVAPAPVAGEFIKYTIQQGAHFCDQSGYGPIDHSEMKFTVRFDSSAIYQTVDPVNQYDINKLFGFSDNAADHHQYSARFGWQWSNGSLKLWAYVYNAGQVISKEITSVPIGMDIQCSISVSSGEYHFRVNDVHEYLPRAATTPRAKGYRLYPYFGGDETAPHTISIWIREI